MAFVHFLFVLIVPRVACGTGTASEPWEAATATGVVLLPLLLLMSTTKVWLAPFRWPLAIQALMGAIAVLVLMPYLTGTTLGGFDLCQVHQAASAGVATTAQRLWVPFELALIGLLWLRAVQAFKAPPPVSA